MPTTTQDEFANQLRGHSLRRRGAGKYPRARGLQPVGSCSPAVRGVKGVSNFLHPPWRCCLSKPALCALGGWRALRPLGPFEGCQGTTSRRTGLAAGAAAAGFAAVLRQGLVLGASAESR